MEPCKISDYVGSFLYLGAAMDKLAEAEPTKLPDPSCAQIRAAVTEYCVLPLGSQARCAEIARRRAEIARRLLSAADPPPHPRRR